MSVLKVKKVVKDIDDIYRANPGDAGLDLRASGKWVVDLDSEKKEIEQASYVLKPSERILVKTGIHVAIPKNHFGSIRDRSGLAFKSGLHTLGGVIDEGYRGEIGVVLVNMSSKDYEIKKNERIAQIILQPYSAVPIEHVEELEETERGEGGYGKSGKH